MQQDVNIDSPLNLPKLRLKQGGTLLEPDNSAIAHWIERMSVDNLDEDLVDPWLWKAWEDAVGDVYTAFPKWADDLLFSTTNGEHMPLVKAYEIKTYVDGLSTGSTTSLGKGQSVVRQIIQTGTGSRQYFGHRRELGIDVQGDILTVH